jgi:hypothetical protein
MTVAIACVIVLLSWIAILFKSTNRNLQAIAMWLSSAHPLESQIESIRSDV